MNPGWLCQKYVDHMFCEHLCSRKTVIYRLCIITCFFIDGYSLYDSMILLKMTAYGSIGRWQWHWGRKLWMLWLESFLIRRCYQTVSVYLGWFFSWAGESGLVGIDQVTKMFEIAEEVWNCRWLLDVWPWWVWVCEKFGPSIPWHQNHRVSKKTSTSAVSPWEISHWRSLVMWAIDWWWFPRCGALSSREKHVKLVIYPVTGRFVRLY